MDGMWRRLLWHRLEVKMQQDFELRQRGIQTEAGGLKAVSAQVEGVSTAVHVFDGGGKGFLIADQMGSGKTLQAILVAKTLLDRGDISNVIVLTRASLCSMWDERLRASGIPTTWIRKSPQVGGATGQMLPRVSTATLTNYSLAIRPQVLKYLRYSCLNRTMIILDESHAVKSTGWKPSKISQAVWGLGTKVAGLSEHARFTVCLTGTPTPNGRNSELHGFLSVAAGADKNYYNYGTDFCGLEQQMVSYSLGTEAWRETRNTNLRAWRNMVKPVSIRRKAGEFADLPDLSFSYHTVEPRREVLKAEKGLPELAAQVERAIDQGDAPEFEEFSTIMRMIGVAKVPAALKLVEDLTETGDPLVVFSRHKSVFDMMASGLEEKGIDTLCMNASLSGPYRGRIVERFQRGEGQVFLTTLGVASEGITLTRASQAVMIELDYSPSRIDQAVARIHRMGQDQHCTVHRLTMRNTIDVRLTELLRKKEREICKQEQ